MLARGRERFRSALRRFKRQTASRLKTWGAAVPSLGSARIALVAVMAFMLVALVYLAQSSNAALVARDLRLKQLKILEIERQNAQLRYDIAALASPSAIETRARRLGLGPAKHVVYADMPWIQPSPNELMPAFLPHNQGVTAPQTFNLDRSTVMEQLLSVFGFSMSDRVSAQVP